MGFGILFLMEETEGEFQKRVLDHLRLDKRIALIWRHDSDRVRARKTRSRDRIGLPDIQGYTSKGESFNLELKRPSGGKMRPAQEAFILKCQSLKIRAGFARSLLEVEAIIFGE